MKNEDLIKQGIDILIENLGIIETTRFLSLVLDEKGFDYTEWRKDNLFKEMSGEEIHELASKQWNGEPGVTYK